MALILVGALSATAIGLLTGRSAFSPFLATQQLSSATLLAQQAALAGNTATTLVVRQTSDDITFTALSSQFRLPRNGATMSYRVAGGAFAPVPAGGLTIGFDDFGRVAVPVARRNIDFRITGESTYNLCLSSLGAVFAGACP